MPGTWRMHHTQDLLHPSGVDHRLAATIVPLPITLAPFGRAMSISQEGQGHLAARAAPKQHTCSSALSHHRGLFRTWGLGLEPEALGMQPCKVVVCPALLS